MADIRGNPGKGETNNSAKHADTLLRSPPPNLRWPTPGPLPMAGGLPGPSPTMLKTQSRCWRLGRRSKRSLTRRGCLGSEGGQEKRAPTHPFSPTTHRPTDPQGKKWSDLQCEGTRGWGMLCPSIQNLPLKSEPLSPDGSESGQAGDGRWPRRAPSPPRRAACRTTGGAACAPRPGRWCAGRGRRSTARGPPGRSRRPLACRGPAPARGSAPPRGSCAERFCSPISSRLKFTIVAKT